MKIYPENNRFIKDIFEDGEYEFLFDYHTVIDIGANIGVFSFWIYDKAEEIYAIEPVRRNLEFMKRTIKENGLTKIKTFQLAISNTSAHKKLERRGKASAGGWRVGKKGTASIPCKTLEDFMDDNKIYYADLVKMDVEGHEDMILNSRYFPHNRIGTIIGEYHLDREKRISKLLEYYGYNYDRVGDNKFIARK